MTNSDYVNTVQMFETGVGHLLTKGKFDRVNTFQMFETGVGYII